MNLLEVQDLQTVFHTDASTFPAVDRISFTIKKGEILGLVGESGCGKSVTAFSLLRLVGPPGEIVGGRILFEGKDLLRIPGSEIRSIRGNKISMIFQEPMTSLNPVLRIGDQIGESLILHKGLSKMEARKQSIELLKAVKIPDASTRVDEYPHQLSGGMRQRVMIAMAIACHPALLIADEPTTALDVTIQAQLLELLNWLRREFEISILLITHALGVVAEIADRVLVMYAGKIVEQAPVQELFAHPAHPYTAGLLESIPRIVLSGAKKERLQTIEGTVPDLSRLPKGCSFYDRCKVRMDICTSSFPKSVSIQPEHSVSCYKHEPA